MHLRVFLTCLQYYCPPQKLHMHLRVFFLPSCSIALLKNCICTFGCFFYLPAVLPSSNIAYAPLGVFDLPAELLSSKIAHAPLGVFDLPTELLSSSKIAHAPLGVFDLPAVLFSSSKIAHAPSGVFDLPAVLLSFSLLQVFVSLVLSVLPCLGSG